MELGFYYAKHPTMSEEDVNYSAHVKMLSVIAEFMMNPEEFKQWIESELHHKAQNQN